MTVYVAVIEGRAVAAFSAMDEVEAEAHLENESFRSDLMVLENNGKALWDGSSQILLRESYDDEATEWRMTMKAAQAGDAEIDHDDFVAYLVPVSNPTDDDDDRESASLEGAA
jgi:hypothetical protein